MVSMKMSLFIHQGGHLVQRQYRLFCHQRNMNPDSQLRILPSQLAGLFHSCSSRHQGGTSQAPLLISFNNSLIYLSMEAKIICIYN